MTVHQQHDDDHHRMEVVRHIRSRRHLTRKVRKRVNELRRVQHNLLAMAGGARREYR
jgi:hypothetical protein